MLSPAIGRVMSAASDAVDCPELVPLTAGSLVMCADAALTPAEVPAMTGRWTTKDAAEDPLLTPAMAAGCEAASDAAEVPDDDPAIDPPVGALAGRIANAKLADGPPAVDDIADRLPVAPADGRDS